jgi:hypothetical protein
MKMKNISQAKLDDLAAMIDNEGFWYSLTDGGYLKPEKLLDNPKDINKVKEAINIIQEFEKLLPKT